MTSPEATEKVFPQWFDSERFYKGLIETMQAFQLEVQTPSGFTPVNSDVGLKSTSILRITTIDGTLKTGRISNSQKGPLAPFVKRIEDLLLRSIDQKDLSEEDLIKRIALLPALLQEKAGNEFLANIVVALHSRMVLSRLFSQSPPQ